MAEQVRKARPKGFPNQGLTYCRPEKARQPLLQKTSKVHCPICNRRWRGPNHDQGLRHRTKVAEVEAAAKKS